MIFIRDSLKLARTKLKTRRIRLTIMLITMSLLFAALAFVAFVAEGTVRSVQSFGEEGYGTNVLVSAYPMAYNEFDNPELITMVQSQHDSLIAQKKALAKKLNITYDEKTDQTLPLTSYQSGPNATDITVMANSSSDITKAALAAQNNAAEGVSYTQFQKRAKSSGATATYRSLANMNYGSVQQSSVKVLKDGQETYTAQDTNKMMYQPPSGIDSITSMGVTQMEGDLLKPFVLGGQSLAVGQDGSLPLIAPYSAAQEILGMAKLPATATVDAKLQRLIDVRKQITGKTALICYRNTTSEGLLQKAIAQRDDIAANKNKKDYVMPALLYNLPATPCGAVTIKSDKRTAEEKKAAQNQLTFDTTFGLSPEPSQSTINVRIIGIGNDIPDGSAINLAGILNTILGSSMGQGWFMPSSAVTPNSVAAAAFGGTIDTSTSAQVLYYASFSTVDQAKEFTKQQNCDVSKAFMENQNQPINTTKICLAANTPYIVTPYGNNAGAIQELQTLLWKFGRYVALAILIIASAVMMGTLGKIIADSRRETAVFRALGAKRFDISQIYLMYALLISILIAIFSFTIGAIGAYIVNRIYSPALSVNAVLAYNASDAHKQFVLFGINPVYIAIILGLIVASALISAIVPLLTNMRRNPIRDMRDES